MTNGVRAIELVVFGVLAVHTSRIWLRRRSPACGWLAATFFVLANLCGLGFVLEETNHSPIADFVRRLAVVELLAIPYLLHRFTTAFRLASRSVDLAVTLATALIILPISIFPFTDDPKDKPDWVGVYTIVFLVYWTVLTVQAAWRLWREGRGHPTLARRRMATLATAALIINFSFILSYFTPEENPLATAVTQALVLVATLVFYVAFNVPSSLKARWRRAELAALRVAERELMIATSRDQVAAAILPQAAALLGGGTASLVDANALTVADVEPGKTVEVGDRLVAARLTDGWLLVEASATAPFFGRDDLDLLAGLGHLVDLALGRASLFDELRSTLIDLTDRERQLGEAQRVANLGSFEWDVESQAATWSDHMRRIFELPEGIEPNMDRFLARVHPDDRHDVVTANAEALAGGDFEVDYRIVREDGAVRNMHGCGSLRDAPDGHSRVVGVVQDVTEKKVAQDLLSHQALHDPLTGLPNRALLIDRVSQALARGSRDRTRPTVVFLDLDRFKSVNDGMGHAAGDELLVAMASRMINVARPSDTVARIGGDEFVLLVDVCDDTEAMRLATRIGAALAQTVVISGKDVSMTCSIGVAIADPGAADAESLVRDADLAMYRAKALGRDRAEMFDAGLRMQAVAQLETQQELQHGLREGELVLHFQPSCDLTTEVVTGVEALVRWRHPTRGLLPPHEFIVLAEQAGLIGSLGTWVLSEACRVGAQLHAAFGDATPTIWVNVSAQQLGGGDLFEVVEEALMRSGLPPALLGLELTETALMDPPPGADSGLQRLRALGVRLALDDFGTGFSSLSHLRNFPFSVIKIDKSFVSGLAVDPEDAAIVSACVALAHSLGMMAVAEGVETIEQMHALRLLGCDQVQGYLVSRPLPAGALQAALRTLDASPWRRSARVAPAARLRVLVCDDEPAARLLLRVGLERDGADVIEVGDGEECLASVREDKPDLVLLDLRMPGHDGYWTLERLHEEVPSLPVFIVTAGAGTPEQAASLGARGFYDKVGVLDRLTELLAAVATPAA